MSMETTTKVFDVAVPEEVRLEVRRNMRAQGWAYKGMTADKDNHGNPLNVQHYERALPDGETGAERSA